MYYKQDVTFAHSTRFVQEFLTLKFDEKVIAIYERKSPDKYS